MRLLLHACCGPCSLEPSRLLRDAGNDITIFYANSNIAPLDEYAHRLETLRTWAGSEGLPVWEGEFDPAAWQASAGRIGEAALAEARAALALRETDDTTAESAGVSTGANGGGSAAAGVSTGASRAGSATAKAAAGTTEAGSKASSESGGDAGGAAAGEADGASGGDTGGAAAGDAGGETVGKAGSGALSESIPGHPEPLARCETAPHSEEERAALAVDPVKRAARCRACYRLRLEETARRAAEAGFDAISTTLSVSPYQYTEIIREELERAAGLAGVRAHFEDFRPYYDKATQRSRDLGMYRQNYCGCLLSHTEAAAERAERKAIRAAERAAEKAAHAEERAAEEAARQARKTERAAYDAKQARKRAILKALREQEARSKQNPE